MALAAALEESSSLAIGNAIGSNIANVGLVLGVTAMVAPLPFAPGVLKLELPWLIAATLLALICLFDLWLGTFDGLVLLAGLWLVMHRLMRKQRGAAHGIRETLEEEL